MRLPKNFLCHVDQDLLTICCTCLQRFKIYKYGDSNLPGASMTTSDFIVNKLEGYKARGLVTLVMVSTVSALEFTTASASAISIWSDSSPRFLT